jgi:dCTP deaminase
MTFLSDRQIKEELDSGNIICTPFERENLSNSSIDLRLGRTTRKIKPSCMIDAVTFDVDPITGRVETRPFGDVFDFDLAKDPYVLFPGDFVLASTLEYVGAAAPHILGQISDKSTMARLGLSTFFGAGYIDPGNVLNITLEIKNNGHVPIELQYGQHICQIRFAYLSSPCENPYNGKYLNDKFVQGAK